MDYILFADEANPEQTDPNKSFIYGGVFVPVSRMMEIHERVDKLRASYGLQPKDQIKFNTRTKPNSITTTQHTEIKSEIYSIAADCGVKFCGYAILHAIAENKDHTTLVEYGANILLAKFNQFLSENTATGWAMFDRINTQTPYEYLKSKFESRLNPKEQNPLEKILGYSFTSDSASNVASLADVLIGGFRYIINEPERSIAGRSIMKSLDPVFWARLGSDGNRYIANRGIVLRPKEQKSVAYQADYAEVVGRIVEWLKSTREK